MNATEIKTDLSQFRGTTIYYKHLFPGKSPLLITEGCDYVRQKCNAHWLFDAILSYQSDVRLKNMGFQIWELEQQKSNLSWLLTCREDQGKPPVIKQQIEFSDFPLECLKIWVIDNVALLPSEY
jgi:hypothetical protein